MVEYKYSVVSGFGCADTNLGGDEKGGGGGKFFGM